MSATTTETSTKPTATRSDQIRSLEVGESIFFPGKKTNQVGTSSVSAKCNYQREFRTTYTSECGEIGTRVTRIK